MADFFWIFVTLICLYLVKWYVCWKPAEYKGRYPVPGRWLHLKRLLYLGIIRLKPKKKTSCGALRQLEESQRSKQECTGGTASHDLERAHKLADDPHAIDSVYFTGFTETDESFIITRIARRPKNKCEVWIFMRVEGVGNFEHPAHPATVLQADSDTSWSAGGLRMECVEPYKIWRISFNGLLRKGPFRHPDSEDDGETVPVKFTLLWTASTDVFDFEFDLEPSTAAYAMALEKTSKKFLNDIKKSSEEHSRYEQWGSQTAEIAIDGHRNMEMSLRGLRNHSYGVRNWEDFHRYVMFVMHFENGTCVHLTIVSIPKSTSHFIVGYVICPNDKKAGIDWSDAHLFHIADDRVITDNYQISFTAGGRSYDVSAKLDPTTSPMVYNGDPSVGDTYECIATFTLGQDCRGWGLVEFYYRDNNPLSDAEDKSCTGAPM